MSHRLSPIEAVADLGRFAITGASVSALLAEATRLAAAVLDAPRAAALRLDRERDELVFEAIGGDGAEHGPVGARRPAAGSLPALVLETGEPRALDDVRSLSDGLCAEWKCTGGALVTPIRGIPESWGCLVVATDAPRRWRRDDLIFVRLFANVLAEAIAVESESGKRHEAEMLLRDVVDSLPDVVARFDLDLRQTFVSRAIEVETGHAPSELVGRSIRDLVDSVAHAPERRDFWEHELSAVIESRSPRFVEFTFAGPEGSTTHHQMHLVPQLDESGAVRGVVSVSRNVTERVQLEERMREASRMEALGKLAGGVAHDFNNLLVAITGYSDLALGALNGAGDETLRTAIREIRRAGDRAANLTKQLLAFSRQQVLRTEVVSLNEIIGDYAPMLRTLLGEEVRLALDLDPALPPTSVDPGQFGQVLMNLAVNARDAMPLGGALTITTDVPPGTRHVRLRVSDTGVGIPEAELHRIWEPFYTTKPPEKGTGLGLATVIGIVEQSKGSISVESTVGVGTTFEIRLDAAVESAPAPADATDREASLCGSGETVLLVEDEAIVRQLVTRMLEAMQYNVVAASTPSEALALAADDRRIDLVITDVVLPEMSGHLLAAKLDALRPGIPVIYSSGYASDAVVERGVLATVDRYLQKPYGQRELAATVAQALAA